MKRNIQPITPDGRAWAPPEFLRDVEDRTITMYLRPNSGDRLPEYAAKMQEKFLGHRVIWLPPTDQISKAAKPE